jgi:CHASE2 domain-containing sensor protein
LVWNGVAGYATPPPGLCFAIPGNQPDPDGTVRRFSAAVEGREENGPSASRSPTMSRVLASSYPDKELDCRSAPPQPSRRIRFTGDFHRFRILPASGVLDDARGRKQFGKYLSDRIVVIGGIYAAARDRYASAAGYLDGVEILAHSTESEISGPVYELSAVASLAVSLVFSVLAYLLASRLPPHWDVAFSILVVPVFSFTTGWVLYRYLSVFVPIASALFSVPLGVIVEHHVECRARQRASDHAPHADPPARQEGGKAT